MLNLKKNKPSLTTIRQERKEGKTLFLEYSPSEAFSKTVMLALLKCVTTTPCQLPEHVTICNYEIDKYRIILTLKNPAHTEYSSIVEILEVIDHWFESI
jgi:hypothetical protein